MSPTARASHGNVMQITTGTRWARTGNASASRRARAAEAAPGRAARVEPAARRDGFQDYYAVKLLRGEISSCSTSWRGAGTRAFRSEIARRHAGGPRLSRPYPRRVPFRSEVARRHAGGPRLSRPYPRRACSDALRRAPSSPLPEISARNKSSILLVIDVESGTGHGRLRASCFALLRNDHLNVADGVAGDFVCVEDEVPAVLGQVEVVVRSDITLQGVLADFHDDGIL